MIKMKMDKDHIHLIIKIKPTVNTLAIITKLKQKKKLNYRELKKSILKNTMKKNKHFATMNILDFYR